MAQSAVAMIFQVVTMILLWFLEGPFLNQHFWRYLGTLCLYYQSESGTGVCRQNQRADKPWHAGWMLDQGRDSVADGGPSLIQHQTRVRRCSQTGPVKRGKTRQQSGGIGGPLYPSRERNNATDRAEFRWNRGTVSGSCYFRDQES